MDNPLINQFLIIIFINKPFFIACKGLNIGIFYKFDFFNVYFNEKGDGEFRKTIFVFVQIIDCIDGCDAINAFEKKSNIF